MGIQDTVENLHRQSERKKAINATLPSMEVMFQLWIYMAETFGHSWASQHGDSPSQVWRHHLAGYSSKEIESGVMNLVGWKGSFPPNAIEFRNLCRSSISPDGFNSDAYLMMDDPRRSDYEPKLIESDEAKASNKETAEKTIGNLKGLFK